MEGLPESKPLEKRARPIWKARIYVSEKRNLNVTMWPPFPGSTIDTPSIVLDEGRMNNKGEWEQVPVKYLPPGRLLELAEILRQVWHEYKRRTSR